MSNQNSPADSQHSFDTTYSLAFQDLTFDQYQQIPKNYGSITELTIDTTAQLNLLKKSIIPLDMAIMGLLLTKLEGKQRWWTIDSLIEGLREFFRIVEPGDDSRDVAIREKVQSALYRWVCLEIVEGLKLANVPAYRKELRDDLEIVIDPILDSLFDYGDSDTRYEVKTVVKPRMIYWAKSDVISISFEPNKVNMQRILRSEIPFSTNRMGNNGLKYKFSSLRILIGLLSYRQVLEAMRLFDTREPTTNTEIRTKFKHLDPQILTRIAKHELLSYDDEELTRLIDVNYQQMEDKNARERIIVKNYAVLELVIRGIDLHDLEASDSSKPSTLWVPKGAKQWIKKEIRKSIMDQKIVVRFGQ